MKFENQAAIVTGAGRGIVQAIAMRLAAEGARVACVGRTPEKARRVADELNSGLHRTYVSDLERGVPKSISWISDISIVLYSAACRRGGAAPKSSRKCFNALMTG